MKAFGAVLAFVTALFVAPALVEWGSHHLPVVGAVAFLLVCIGFATLGAVADYYGEQR